MAEEVGFEPTKGYKPLPVFKTGAFNRSATLPNLDTRESAYITWFQKVFNDPIEFLLIILFIKYLPIILVTALIDTDKYTNLI